ncbi:MAG: GTP-dependent dephospho-CoA kinase family protein [Candidatus Hodarchaeales archaeon]
MAEKLKENQLYILPDSLRSQLAEPMGQLYTFIDDVPPERRILPLLQQQNSLVVTVGDVVTDSLFSVHFYPNIAIIDNKTLRGEYKSNNLSNLETFYVRNPPATITHSAWNMIHNLYKSFKEDNIREKMDLSHHSNKENTKIVVIDGEEDLLVIPCIMVAPIGSLILYGQPKQGIVIINVNKSVKETIANLLQKFEKKTSVQS